VFHSTQYIRHPSEPLYTPEPDIIHELMGHAPMFANPDFAEFSQMIGLASLGCSDMDLPKIATIYWFTVEFGLCMEDGKRKAYGAGILSSVGELEYAMSDKPEFLPLDCELAGEKYQNFPISSVQPTYFVAESFKDAKDQFEQYVEGLGKPFHVYYDDKTHSIDVDRKIRTKMAKEGGLSF
jgi:phenylalanine-4-hydroxylase